MNQQPTHSEQITAIILAAGQGKRMRSSLPKVLHPMCGQPLIDWVVEAALAAGAHDAVVVVGHQRALVQQHLKQRFGQRVRFAVQHHQRGTGHAARCALPLLATTCTTALLLYGDTPLVQKNQLRAMLAARRDAPSGFAMLTCNVADPCGYGRIVRNHDNHIVGIVEHRDCTPAQRHIDEINPGMYACAVPLLTRSLAALTDDNDQGELYLTDVVAMAAKHGRIAAVEADASTLMGINDRAQLAHCEPQLHRRIANHWRREGATIRAGVIIDAAVVVEADALLEHGVVLRGNTRIGAGARIDVGCVLDDVTVAAGAYLRPYSVCARSRIGEGAKVGPFSHLRPGSDIGPDAKVGNFVETKQVTLRRGAKASHLSYLGDGDVGAGANIGAGTIFCNYDGFQKHRTEIGAGAFIGSGSQLVAPVRIGEGAYVATGTTVTKDVPADGLAIARTRQTNKEGYASRLRGRLQARAAANEHAGVSSTTAAGDEARHE